jgi:DNA repair exonuclease SbcCD ATPase subunit
MIVAIVLVALASGVAAQPQDLASLVPPVDRSASQSLRTELDRTRASLVRAQLNVHQASRVVENTARQTDAYREAVEQVQSARQQLGSIQQPILDALWNDPDYAALRNRQTELRSLIEAEFRSLRPNLRRIGQLAAEILELSPRIARFEIIALALEPEVEPARQELFDAFASLRQLNRQARETASGDASVRIARGEIDQLRTRVEAINQQLVEALKQEAEAERLRQARLDAVRGRNP